MFRFALAGVIAVYVVAGFTNLPSAKQYAAAQPGDPRGEYATLSSAATEEDMKRLASRKNLAHLTLTVEGVKELQKALPKCRITK